MKSSQVRYLVSTLGISSMSKAPPAVTSMTAAVPSPRRRPSAHQAQVEGRTKDMAALYLPEGVSEICGFGPLVHEHGSDPP